MVLGDGITTGGTSRKALDGSQTVIDLSSLEMLEAMNNGLTGRPFILLGSEGELKLSPKSFNFDSKTIQFETEIGEKVMGRQILTN
jgi:hypothetical protein